jgi:hypothetical protein
MSRLSVFAAATFLSVLATTPMAFATEHHHVRTAPQHISLPARAYAGPQPLMHYHDTPSYNDPSKNGCCG